jgi:hypothetical protein
MVTGYAWPGFEPAGTQYYRDRGEFWTMTQGKFEAI